MTASLSGPKVPMVKICGLTRQEDVDFCRSAGVDWLGFNFISWSKRVVSPAVAQRLWGASNPGKSQSRAIGIVADHSLAEISQFVGEFPSLTGLQLHGSESIEFVRQVRGQFPNIFLIKAVGASSEEAIVNSKQWSGVADLVLFDTPAGGSRFGGSGKTFPWSWLEKVPSITPCVSFGVAGGLTPENLAEVLRWGPALVDLNSGVESSPGIKSAPLLIEALKVLARRI